MEHNARHFDAPLGVSYHRAILWAAFVGLIVGIVALSGVGVWQWAVLIVACVAVIVLQNQVPIPRHLVQLSSKDDDSHWQILVKTTRGEQIWQGRLMQAKVFGLGVWLDFEIDEPMIIEFKTVVFFDQLDDDDRRKLKMAIRFF